MPKVWCPMPDVRLGAAVNHDRENILPLIPRLRSHAWRLAGGGNAHLVDDLVQDTVVLALQGWDGFAPGTDLKSWLFRILRNRFHDVVRRRHVRAEVRVEDLGRLASVPAEQEFRAGLPGFRRAFAGLSPSHREVLVLRAVHGLPYARIAEACGCEVAAVKSRLNRARAALRAAAG